MYRICCIWSAWCEVHWEIKGFAPALELLFIHEEDQTWIVMTITSPSCTLNKVLLGGEAGWHDRESTRIGFSSLGTNS